MADVFDMANFVIDPWTGQPVKNQGATTAANPWTQFDLGGLLNPSSAGVAATPVSGPSWWDRIVGGKNADGTAFNGLGGLALGTLQGFGNLYGSMKNYGLAKEDFEFKKAFAEKNLANQTQLVNNQIRDRNNARNAANPGAYQPIPLLT